MGCTEQRQEQLIDQLAAATGTMHLATARVVEILATTFTEGAWECSGIKSREHFVMWQLGVSRRRAEGLVALAIRRDELPATTARLDAGEFSEDHATSIAQRCPVTHEARTVEHAPKLTHPQLVRALRLLPPLPEPDADPAELTPLPRLARKDHQHRPRMDRSLSVAAGSAVQTV